MPIRVHVSHEFRLLVITFTGVVTAEDVERDLIPLIDVPEYSLMPMILFDMTAALRSEGPSDVVRWGARRAAKRVDAHVETGAKMALVATSDEFYGFGRMYQLLRNESPKEFSVFRDRAEAEQWLGLPDDYQEGLESVV